MFNIILKTMTSNKKIKYKYLRSNKLIVTNNDCLSEDYAIKTASELQQFAIKYLQLLRLIKSDCLRQ
ncbi:hypothetical protein SAMN05216283_11064 [Sunxiuqinia elliptica]|uniref:Uncharacterized protein n=1 Tax=Sunxiuqinia elliptica TaxID=655355 RepID=A0A1I2JXB3_9BACT|nr:hypothetical protein SAMN05216283_11064 [Sunxiuqinia elliptica]